MSQASHVLSLLFFAFYQSKAFSEWALSRRIYHPEVTRFGKLMILTLRQPTLRKLDFRVPLVQMTMSVIEIVEIELFSVRRGHHYIWVKLERFVVNM